MPLHDAIVCDLQYLYAILALYIPEIFKFFMYYYIVLMEDCHVRTRIHAG